MEEKGGMRLEREREERRRGGSNKVDAWIKKRGRDPQEENTWTDPQLHPQQLSISIHDDNNPHSAFHSRPNTRRIAKNTSPCTSLSLSLSLSLSSSLTPSLSFSRYVTSLSRCASSGDRCNIQTRFQRIYTSKPSCPLYHLYEATDQFSNPACV